MLCVPAHVALIMDGNGRWAAARGLSRSEGHRRGASSVRKVLRAAEREGVKYVTLYALSSENFFRPRDEIDFLMNLCERFLKKFGKKFFERRTRFRMIGDPSPLPDSLQHTIGKLESDTASFDQFNVTVALNYSARSEIVRAVKNLFRDGGAVDDLGWDVLRTYLYTAELPDPDLIIRTSGEQRLSNFLLLQSAYAEFFFTKTFWPDFGEKEFLVAIEDYKHREKRMGRVNGKKSV
jgi:undecaprenyl diphosphate synthase